MLSRSNDCLEAVCVYTWVYRYTVQFIYNKIPGSACRCNNWGHPSIWISAYFLHFPPHSLLPSVPPLGVEGDTTGREVRQSEMRHQCSGYHISTDAVDVCESGEGSKGPVSWQRLQPRCNCGCVGNLCLCVCPVYNGSGSFVSCQTEMLGQRSRAARRG